MTTMQAVTVIFCDMSALLEIYHFIGPGFNIFIYLCVYIYLYVYTYMCMCVYIYM
jgi:hypothetical protein